MRVGTIQILISKYVVSPEKIKSPSSISRYRKEEMLMDFEFFLDQNRGGSRQGDRLQGEILDFLIDELMDRSRGRDRDRRDNRHHQRGPDINERVNRIADEMDYGDVDAAVRKLDRNIPQFGEQLLNRVLRREQRNYGADLEIVPTYDQWNRPTSLIRLNFPTRDGLACQDVGLFSQQHRTYTSMQGSRPYYCR